MDLLNNYLNILNEETWEFTDGYEPKKGDTMKCEVCGRTVHLLNNGKGPLLCCGQPMKKYNFLPKR